MYLRLLLTAAALFASSLVASDDEMLLTQSTEKEGDLHFFQEEMPKSENGYTVNFDNIPVTQLIRFISQISGTNFIYDAKDLTFDISIVSVDPTSVDDLMAALLQVLKMNNLSVVEQGNNVLIFKDENLSKISTIVTDDNLVETSDAAVVTRVFRLNNISPEKVSGIIRPLLSKDAIVEVSEETHHLIVSDIAGSVEKVADLLSVLDVPSETLEVAEYKVKSAYPAALVSYAKEILHPLVQKHPLQLIAQPSSHKIFIVSTPYLIKKTKAVLKSLDEADITEIADLPATDIANNVFEIYKLRYHDGKDIAGSIRDIGTNLQGLGVGNVDFISAIQSIEWIEANNSIVFSGTEAATSRIKELIGDLDQAPKQVYIEVLIIDTTVGNSLDFGVQWVALGNEQDKLAYASGLLNSAPSSAPIQTLTGTPQNPLYGGARAAGSAPPPNAVRGGSPGTGGDIPLTAGFGLGIVGNIIRHNGESFLTLGSLINALEGESDTTIVLNPRIMAEESQEANIFVGQNIPYQTTSTVIRDTGSVTQNIQYEDIGVQLRVTPLISPDNTVTLVIDQSISEVVSSSATVTTTAGTTVLLSPTTNKTLTTTRVHVPDGSFLVMSGHIRDNKTFNRTGIPCLGSLPLIGPTFSSTSESRDKRNLIMFIRPKVIATGRQGVDITNEEGYDFNWNANPCSVIECGTTQAPECEEYIPPPPIVDDRFSQALKKEFAPSQRTNTQSK